MTDSDVSGNADRTIVYIVTDGEYDWYNIRAVFLSERCAERYIERTGCKWDMMRVESFPVRDDEYPETADCPSTD